MSNSPAPKEGFSYTAANFHINKARRFLSIIGEAEEKMIARQQDPVVKAQDDHTGVTALFNQSQDWTLNLAQVHALIAIAVGVDVLADQLLEGHDADAQADDVILPPDSMNGKGGA